MRIETAKELKIVLDEHLKHIAPGTDLKTFRIHLSARNYDKAKYSCTIDEQDFIFNRGEVYYRGIKLATPGT